MAAVLCSTDSCLWHKSEKLNGTTSAHNDISFFIKFMMHKVMKKRIHSSIKNLLERLFPPAISCVRDQDVTTEPARHR